MKKAYFFHTLPRAVIEAVNRFHEGMVRKRNFDAGASKKHRRSTIMQSAWRSKMSSLLHKDQGTVSEVCSQKKKSIFPDLPRVEFLQSYHDSSVDKVQYACFIKIFPINKTYDCRNLNVMRMFSS